jgi:hypothetical protein
MSEHTKGPWKYDKKNARITASNPESANGCDTICEFPAWKDEFKAEQQSNADFIVRACNSHDELVGACKCALAACKTAAIYDGAKKAGWINDNGNWPLHNMLAAALAKAGGK